MPTDTLARELERAETVTPEKLRGEYVAGSFFGWVQQQLETFIRTLPPYTDDLEVDFGLDLYDRMLWDPAVHSAIQNRVAALLAPGVELQPVVEEDQPEYARAREIRDFCQHNLDRLALPFQEVLRDLIALAFCYGHRIAELVYEPAERGELAGFPGVRSGALVLKVIKPKDRRHVAMAVDRAYNVRGFVAAPFAMLLPAAGGFLGGYVDPERLLPAEKFWLLTNRPKASDPRGQSDLRCAYNAWWLKMQAWVDYLKYLATYANPSIVGFTPEGAVALPVDITGTNQYDEKGNLLTPERLMLTALQQIRNGGVAAFRGGSAVQLLQATGNGEPFLAAIDLFDRQMEKGISGQTLMASEGEHSTRAQSQTHQDVHAMSASVAKRWIGVATRRILMRVVEYNYGPDARRLTPHASYAEAEQQDLPALWGGVANLQKSAYLGPSQRAKLDALVGLPPRDGEADAKAAEEEQAQAMELQQQSAGATAQDEDSANA